jgi:hypothetical protein
VLLTVLTWAWRVSANLVYLLVVGYVLGQLHGRPETVIVPILGLIYVTIRVLAIGLGLTFMQLGISLDDLRSELRTGFNPQYQRDLEELEEIRRAAASSRARLYLDDVFLGLISLLCLFQLFSAL